MRGTVQLIAAFTAVVIIGTAGYLAPDYIQYSGDLIIENYMVTFSSDGFLTETIDYDIAISDKYSTLSRVWKVPVINPEDDGINRPYMKVNNLRCPPYTAAFVKDTHGNLWISEKHARYRLLMKHNEISCYTQENYDAGKYNLTYMYQAYLPMECDDALCRMNLQLADEHVPYRNVEIFLKGDRIKRVFPHPPDFGVSLNGSGWVIRGKSPRDGLIEVEMLMKPEAAGKFVTEVSDIEEKTAAANVPYSKNYFLLTGLKYVLIATILGFPVILYLVYRMYGTGKGFAVPAYLCYVPAKRKPWFVNMVFKGGTFDFDANGFYATLLDLHRRGFIKIEPENNEVRIQFLKTPEEGDDPYEAAVLSFLHDWSAEGVFHTGKFKDKVKSMAELEEDVSGLKSRMDLLMRRSYPALAGNLLVRGRGFLVLFIAADILAIYLYACRTGAYPIFVENAVYAGTLALQSLVMLIFKPSTLFGRWKAEYYKEKMEWDGFRSFLSDIEMIKKHAPGDADTWKDRLIYGTALGAGDKVVKAMDALQVEIPEVRLAPAVFKAFRSVSAAVAAAYSPVSRG